MIVLHNIFLCNDISMKKFILTSLCIFIGTTAYSSVVGGAGVGSINQQYNRQFKQSQIERNLINTTEDSVRRNKKLKQKQEEYEAEQKRIREEKYKGMYNPQFILNKVRFVGNTEIKDKKLQKLYKNLIGKEIYFSDLLELTILISRYYQKEGFITSYAKILPQDIIDGDVTISIVESRIGSKVSEGEHWARQYYINKTISGQKYMREGDVFNVRALQGTLKTINRSDYMQGGAAITKDPETNLTDIKLEIQDRFPVSFDFSVDDYGRDYSGRHRVTMIGAIDNLTGFGDRIYGGPILSDKTTGVMAGYQIPINSRGTKVGFDFSNTAMGLGGPYKALGVKGKFTNYSMYATQSIIKNTVSELEAKVSYDILTTSSTAEGLGTPVTLSDYTLNIIRASLYGSHDDRYGRWIGSIGSDFGLTSSQDIKNGPQGLFYKLLASVARVQRLPKKCLGIARVHGQYSPQALYAAEQMFIGGAYSIRGYQPAELIGDYGVAGSFEVRTPIPLLDKILPEKISFIDNKLRLVFFYDWGYVGNHADMYNNPTNFLHSVGFGGNIEITPDTTLQIGAGIPLGTKHLGEDSIRIYFSVNSAIDKLFLKPKNRIKDI